MAEFSRVATYGGTVLPNYPSNDFHYNPQTYRYSLIVYVDGKYIMLQCSQPFYQYSDDVVCYPASAAIQGYGANKSLCTWVYGDIIKEEGFADYYKFKGKFVWSNADIYWYDRPNVKAYSGDLWFANEPDAQEPVITRLTGAVIANDEGTATGYWTGDTAESLVCEAEVADGGTLTYKWYRNGTYVGSGKNYTPSTMAAGQFAYYCIVTNTLTAESGFSDIDTVQSESMVIVVTQSEVPDNPDTPVVPDVKAAKHKHIIGYVLKQSGVPMAELIAEMLGKVKKTAPLYLYGTPSTSGNIGLRNGESVTYYDGAVLNELPESDLPYAAIWRKATDGTIVLTLTETPETVGVGGATIVWDTDIGYTYNSGEWVSGVSASLNYELIWANFDAYYADGVENVGGTLFLSASDPIPVSGLVGCSYNGTVLPELPEWDKTAYPYAVIDNTLMNMCRLHLFEHLPFATTTDNGYVNYGPMDGSTYIYKGAEKAGTVNNGWTFNATYTDDDGIIAGYGVQWTNFDLLYEDGAVCCAKSDPIPVYE